MENVILDMLKGIRNSLESFQRTGLYSPAKYSSGYLLHLSMNTVMEYWRKKLDASFCVSFLILR